MGEMRTAVIARSASDEAIQLTLQLWIAWSLSSGAHSRDPLTQQ
jgi:hypothetical protein